MTPHIIGISGNMGARKTTLTRNLARDLRSSFLIWDDFDEISDAPKDYIAWYKRGGSYIEWNYPKLAEVLKSLKFGKAVRHPVRHNIINPTQYIIFDAPLGRFHQQTGIYIDTWIHIDVPLDVSLCRWLLREYKGTDKSRPLFNDNKFKDEADLMMDGMLPTTHQVERVKQFILK
jgi:uridine kinase